MATIIEIQESKFEHLSDCAEQIVKHGKKLMHCLSELESKLHGKIRKTQTWWNERF